MSTRPNRTAAATLADEVLRVATQHEHAQDAARRSWPAFVGTFLANLGLALVPGLPGSERVLGSLTVGEALTCAAPGLALMMVSFVLYQRLGGQSPVYRLCSEVEEVALQGFLLGMVSCAGTAASVVWCATPISARYRGMLQPRRPGLSLLVHALTLAPLAVWFAVRGQRGEALFVCFAWSIFAVILLGTSGGAMRVIRLEAVANLTRARLDRAREAAERQEFEDTLEQRIGGRLQGLLDELVAYDANARWDAELLQHARDALTELERAVGDLGAGDAPAVRGELCAQIARKCRAILPAGVEVEVEYGVAGPDAAVAPRVSLATLRVTRELTRNADAHGSATRVRIAMQFSEHALELWVSDDGAGLGQNAWSDSQGGLHNAQVWAAMLGGSVELGAPIPPWTTRIRWNVPTGAARR